MALLLTPLLLCFRLAAKGPFKNSISTHLAPAFLFAPGADNNFRCRFCALPSSLQLFLYFSNAGQRALRSLRVAFRVPGHNGRTLDLLYAVRIPLMVGCDVWSRLTLTFSTEPGLRTHARVVV